MAKNISETVSKEDTPKRLEDFIPQLEKQRDLLLAARRKEADRFGPRLKTLEISEDKSIDQAEEKKPDKTPPYFGHDALKAIFEFLNRLTLSAGLGALGTIIVNQKIALEFGGQTREWVSLVAGYFVAFIALALSFVITLDLLQKMLPEKMGRNAKLIFYFTGSVLILISMMLFQAAVNSAAKKSDKPTQTISIIHGKGEQKIEVLIVGDQKINETLLTIEPKTPSGGESKQAENDSEKVD